jgi:hypothetical protein
VFVYAIHVGFMICKNTLELKSYSNLQKKLMGAKGISYVCGSVFSPNTGCLLAAIMTILLAICPYE